MSALDELDLTVRAGEVHGFLKANSTGKSTTSRILLDLAKADSGNAAAQQRTVDRPSRIALQDRLFSSKFHAVAKPASKISIC